MNLSPTSTPQPNYPPKPAPSRKPSRKRPRIQRLGGAALPEVLRPEDFPPPPPPSQSK